MRAVSAAEGAELHRLDQGQADSGSRTPQLLCLLSTANTKLTQTLTLPSSAKDAARAAWGIMLGLLSLMTPLIGRLLVQRAEG